MAISKKDVVVGALVIELLGSTKKFAESMAKGKKATDKFTGNLVKNKKLWESGGRTMAAAGGLITGALGLAVKKAADFDQAITNSASVTGKTGEEFTIAKEKMADLAKTLGQTTVFSATEAANAFFDLSSKGFDVASMSVQQLEPFLNLATATNSDLTLSTETLTSTLRGFGLVNDDTGRIADVFTKAIGSSAAMMEKFGISMPIVSTSAKTVGAEFEEVTGALSLLFNKGIEASTAATGLRNVFMELNAPTKKVSELIKKAGINMKDLDVETVGISGAMQAFADKGVTAKEMMTAFGKKTGTVTAALFSSRGELDEFTASLLNSAGTAKEVAEQQLNTLWGAMKLLTSAIESVVIPIGEALLPALSKIAQTMAPVIRSVSQWMKEHEGLTKILVLGTAAVGALFVALGPILVILPGLALVATGFGISISGLLVPIAGVVAGFALLVRGVQQVTRLIDIFRDKQAAAAADEQTIADERRLLLKAGVGEKFEFTEKMIEQTNRNVENTKAALAETKAAIEGASAEERKALVDKHKALTDELRAHLTRAKALAENHHRNVVTARETFNKEMEALEQDNVEAIEAAREKVIGIEEAAAQIQKEGARKTLMASIEEQASLVLRGSKERIEVEGATQESIGDLIETANKKQIEKIEIFLGAVKNMKDKNKNTLEQLERRAAATSERIVNDTNVEKNAAIAKFLAGKENLTKGNMERVAKIEEKFQAKEKERLAAHQAKVRSTIVLGKGEIENLEKDVWERRVELSTRGIAELLISQEGLTAEQIELGGLAQAAAQGQRQEELAKVKVDIGKRRDAELEATQERLQLILKFSRKVRTMFETLSGDLDKESDAMWKTVHDNTSNWLDNIVDLVRSRMRQIKETLEGLRASMNDVSDIEGDLAAGGPDETETESPGALGRGRFGGGGGGAAEDETQAGPPVVNEFNLNQNFFGATADDARNHGDVTAREMRRTFRLDEAA